MRRALTIAKRDYLAAVRTKAFLVSLLLLPLLSSLAVTFQVWSAQADKGTTKHFAIVDRTLALRFEGATSPLDRLLVVNLDADVNLATLSDPIVAPPAEHQWGLRWCSDEAKYGGSGVAAIAPPERLIAGGQAATLFEPRALS